MRYDPKRSKSPYNISGQEFMELMGYNDLHAALRYMHHLIKTTKNTPLARKLAIMYKEYYDEDFPGGVKNAFILRHRPGHWQRSSGAISWSLESISVFWKQDHNHPRNFTSCYKAKDTVKNKELINI